MAASLVRFLLARGLVAPAAVADEALHIVTTRRDRFALHEVHVAGEPVCTAKTARSASAVPYLAAEGAVLEFVAAHVALRGLAPACLARDPEAGVLVLEHVAAGGTRGATGVETAEAAHALAAVHRETVGVGLGVTATWPPAFDALCRGWTPKPEALRRLWTYSTDAPSLARHIGRARQAWQRRCLVHTDVKREHWLHRIRPNPQRLCLIDWELVRRGDPAWDVASAVVEHVLVGLDGAARPAAGVGLPAGARAFLARYRRAAGPYVWHGGFEHRVIDGVAVRLLQTALETLTMDVQSNVGGMVSAAESVFGDAAALARDVVDASRERDAA